MSKIFRETTGWILRYSGWRRAIPVVFLCFFSWIAAEIIFRLDQWKERKDRKAYLKEIERVKISG